MSNIAHWKRPVKEGLLSGGIIQEVLSSSWIEGLCREARYSWRQSFWSPTLTVLAFLLQVLDGSKTLRSAVAILLTQLAIQERTDLPSADPTAFCQARRRFPREAMRSLLGHVAGQMRDLVQQTTSWRGCRVWVVDGSNVSMPDTPDLQRAFPQHCQKAGCGFPIAQFVALFCWTTGAILDVAIDTLRPHEITLFRNRWHHFQAGDVVLADRAYCNYVDMARLQQLGVNSVFRLHQRRCCDFRRVKRLGYDDGRVLWPRPHSWWPSMGIDQETFETLPPTLAIRLIRMTNAPRGFRSRTVVVATTLLDPIQYPADEIRRLYRDRWTAELNFRSLKTQLGMDMLHGKSRDVVLKEIIMHLLAYNLIRLLMWEAARQHGRDLHRLSLAGTLHRIRFIFPRLLLQPSRANLSGAKLFQQLLAWIAADPIPHRPDRIEPRRVKRRPKTYSRLTKPRDFYRRRTVGADRDAR